MSGEIKNGDILELMDEIGKKFNSDKDKQRLLIAIHNMLKLVKNNQGEILHLCDDCKRQTLENARMKATEFGIVLDQPSTN